MILTLPDFVDMTTSGLEYGEVECWINPAARYGLRVASTSLAKIGLMQWGREVTGSLPSGTEIVIGIKEHDPKSVFEVENTSGNSQSTSSSYSMAGGVQPRPCKLNQPPAGAAVGGPRHARPNNVGSNVPVAPARATSRTRLPHLCQANF